ncbi:unnamed protein product, partial [Closterium sp. NIES-54]
PTGPPLPDLSPPLLLQVPTNPPPTTLLPLSPHLLPHHLPCRASAPPALHPLPRTLILPPAASCGGINTRVMRGDQYALALGLLDQGEVVVGVLCFSALPHCSPCTPSPLTSPPSPPPPHHSFMRGDQYAVALGLLDQGDVVVGVLGCPNLPCASIAHGVEAAVTTGQPVGCVFSAVKGRGTTVQPLHEAVPPRQVRRGGVEVGGWGGGDVGGLRWGGWRKGVSSESNPAMATFCESYESRHSKHNLTASIAQALGVVAPPVRIDSQAKYGAMARGDAAIYMRFPPDGYREKIWDHAAGSLVISGVCHGMGLGVMGWDGMGWDGMGWDGGGWDVMGWDGMGWDGMSCHVMSCHVL